MTDGQSYRPGPSPVTSPQKFTIRETCSLCNNDARYTAVGLGAPPAAAARVCGVHADDLGAAISDDKLPDLIRSVAYLLHELDRNRVPYEQDRRQHLRGLLGLRSVDGCVKSTCQINMRCSYPTECSRWRSTP